jgi:hypothetical protein
VSAPRAPQNEYERYVELADRESCDESLSAEERDFCRSFEQRCPEWCPEVACYAELGKLNPVPDASSRTLVDRALAQVEAEDAARATDEAKLMRRSRGPGWPTLVAVAGFALGAAYALIERAPNRDTRASNTPAPLVRAELVYASGSVKVSGTTGAAGRALLAQGSVVETSQGGACVLIDSDINVCLGPDSRMRLSKVAPPVRVIELEAGKLAARLSAQPEGNTFSILADGVMTTAVGTAFSVERTEDASVVTTVLNGKVRMGRGELTTLVNAHERAISLHGDTARPSVTSVRRTEEAPSWALLGPTVLWHDPVAATLEVQGDPVGADAWLDDQWLGSTPISSLIPVGEHRLIVRKDHRELMTRDIYVHAGEIEDVHYDGRNATLLQAQAGQLRANHDLHDLHDVRDVRDVRDVNDSDEQRTIGHSARRAPARASREAVSGHELAAVPAVEQRATADGPELFGQARLAIRIGQYRQAADVYEKIIDSGADSNDARTALVMLGQLRLNQLKDPRSALEPLNAYLQTGGALESEARVARIEALRELKRTSDEASAIEDFLQHHARSFEAKRMRARLQTLRGE